MVPQDIVTASPKFSVEPLIPKLRDYMRVTNPYKRQFLISWITVLDSVPDLDLLAHLPQLLDGLLNLLSDPNREIRVAAHKCTMEFLVEIQVCLISGTLHTGAGSGGLGAVNVGLHIMVVLWMMTCQLSMASACIQSIYGQACGREGVKNFQGRLRKE